MKTTIKPHAPRATIVYSQSMLIHTMILILLMATATHSNGLFTIEVVGSNNTTGILIKSTDSLYYAKANQTIRVSCQLEHVNDGLAAASAIDRNEYWHEYDVVEFQEERNFPGKYLRHGPSAEFRLESVSRKFGCHDRRNTNNVPLEDIVAVIVGMPPGPLRRFDCEFDTKSMNCTAEPTKAYPSHNITAITTVRFAVGSQTDDCNFIFPQNPSRCEITINQDDSPDSQPNIKFSINQTNELGHYSEEHTINLTQSLIPPPVQQLTATNIRGDGANVSWENDPGLNPYKLDIVYKLQFSSKHTRKKTIYDIADKYYNLEGLPFGYTSYQVSVRSKVRTSSPHKRWSNRAEISFRTESRVPDTPNTAPGAFYFNDIDQLTVYWTPLTTLQKHAPSVSYLVNNENATSDFSYDLGYHYKTPGMNVTIFSHSDRGPSRHPLQVHVPPAADRCGVPTYLKKVLSSTHGQQHDKIYNFSWSSSTGSKRRPVDSYTVFWCTAKTESENQCKSGLSYKRVNASVTSFSFRVGATLTINFAVSANCGSSVSGMSWTSCAAVNESEISHLHPVWLNATTLQWKPVCKDTALLTGFTIKYYWNPYTDPVIINLTNPNQRQYTFNDLQTDHNYTFYLAGTTATSTNQLRFNEVLESRPTALSAIKPHEFPYFMVIVCDLSVLALGLLALVFLHRKIQKIKIDVSLPPDLDPNSPRNRDCVKKRAMPDLVAHLECSMTAAEDKSQRPPNIDHELATLQEHNDGIDFDFNQSGEALQTKTRHRSGSSRIAGAENATPSECFSDFDFRMFTKSVAGEGNIRTHRNNDYVPTALYEWSQPS